MLLYRCRRCPLAGVCLVVVLRLLLLVCVGGHQHLCGRVDAGRVTAVAVAVVMLIVVMVL